VSVELSDQSAGAPSYAKAALWYGQVQLDEGDLFVEPFKNDPECVLVLSNGASALAPVNSWDQGGRRAQVVGVGPPPF